MLSTSCALAFAVSLVEPAQCDHMCEAGGEPPSLAEVLLHDPRWVVSERLTDFHHFTSWYWVDSQCPGHPETGKNLLEHRGKASLSLCA